jgi:hypothetical protein
LPQRGQGAALIDGSAPWAVALPVDDVNSAKNLPRGDPKTGSTSWGQRHCKPPRLQRRDSAGSRVRAYLAIEAFSIPLTPTKCLSHRCYGPSEGFLPAWPFRAQNKQNRTEKGLASIPSKGGRGVTLSLPSPITHMDVCGVRGSEPWELYSAVLTLRRAGHRVEREHRGSRMHYVDRRRCSGTQLIALARAERQRSMESGNGTCQHPERGWRLGLS